MTADHDSAHVDTVGEKSTTTAQSLNLLCALTWSGPEQGRAVRRDRLFMMDRGRLGTSR
jgi:hypothetical protein